MATIELTGENFATHVEESDILFVDFWASWCGPCQQFAPTYEAASEAHPDITFGSINTEEQRELAAAAQVRSIPTLMAFRDGILVFSQPGALPPAALDDLIGKVRELDMDDVRRQRFRRTGRTGQPRHRRNYLHLRQRRQPRDSDRRARRDHHLQLR